MGFVSLLFLVGIGLFAAMVVLLEIGRRWGRKQRELDPEHWHRGVGVADGAVFALFGLLIAFSFSGASERYHERRRMITTEANAIGTAWLRLDLLPPEYRERARAEMRDYVDARLAVVRAFPDLDAVDAAIRDAAARQNVIWNEVMAARGGEMRGWEVALLPALNEAFDVANERVQSMYRHSPKIVFVLLIVLGLGCAMLAGIALAESSHRPTLHILAFAAITAVTIYVILDLEYPRYGLIRIDAADRVMIELRESMR